MLNPQFTQDLTILGGFILLLWLLEAIDQFFLHSRLDQIGIRPRRIRGLRGILFAPLLHGSWQHVGTNTLPLLVLGSLTLWRGLEEFWIVTAVTWVVSGAGVWLLGGKNTVHVGASGLIFGYFGFLLARSYFEQDPLSAVFSLVVALLYGPIMWGVLPLRRGISWQGHLFGLIGGVLAARHLIWLKTWVDLF